jgi:hypothetical protein
MLEKGIPRMSAPTMYCLKCPVGYERAGNKPGLIPWSIADSEQGAINYISVPKAWPNLQTNGWQVVKVRIVEEE